MATSSRLQERLFHQLTTLYGPTAGRDTWQRLLALLDQWRPRIPSPRGETFPHPEVFVIAYGDHVLPEVSGTPKLQALHRFLRQVASRVQGLHLLPFFPYSSDDGFAIIDYTAVRPDLGSWSHVEALAQDFTLMVDLVLNHVSRQSPWFQAFVRGDPEYRDFFLVVDDPHDPAWSKVVRPRTTPLFTPVETNWGRVFVWTTFSPDQVDLNYRNPAVLLRMVEVMLHYLARGARVVRLDAVAYTWKAPGTPCIHQPQAHLLVKIFRTVADLVAPGVRLITETNVPHQENVAYFGQGWDEAHMVYNFTLPPLTLYAFLQGDARPLTRWAKTLHPPGEQTAFFNFLASHDGIGVTPAQGWLSEEQLARLYRATEEHGGLLSFKALAGGGRRVYELNITWYDALNAPHRPTPWDVSRFLATYGLMLSLQGVPAVYFSSLFGARNCTACVERWGYARAINREKYPEARLQYWLQGETHHARVFRGMLRLLETRAKLAAFHPRVPQEVLDVGAGAFGLVRHHERRPVLVLVSVHAQGQRLTLRAFPGTWHDALSGERVHPAQGVALAPYQVRWLHPV